MKKLIRKLSIFFILAVRISIANAQQVVPKVLIIGDAAPNLKVQKWLKGDGFQTFDKGKVYVVEFWATWCGPCIAGMPHLSRLAKQYEGKASFAGISILERGENILPRVSRFVDSNTNNMRYNVALDDSNFMVVNWMNAAGQHGIPFSFVISDGKIAWMGHPELLDAVIPAIIKGDWDVSKAIKERENKLHMDKLDQEAIRLLNPLMIKHEYAGGYEEIKKFIAEHPEMKYTSYLGHFTFYCLLNTNPEAALEYCKQWFAANKEPDWKGITEAVHPDREYPKAVYILSAESFQAQLDHYPWAMNFPETYKKMSELYKKAGDNVKSEEFLKKSELPAPPRIARP